MVERPGWTEIVGVLLACAVALAVLAHLDAVGAREAGARAVAQPVVAEASPLSSPHARQELALVLAGTGFALTAAGSLVLSRRRSA